ncbi:MAG: hypothetical protein KJ063_18915 [Anaerolineae bacterium]|nr:hypothetical protein [Anaerolineae bacterium]
MGQFDWQTDTEEEGWDDLPPLEPTRPLPLWQRFVIIGIVLSLVGSSALVALRQISFRSQRSSSRAIADVQAAHELWRLAVSQGDTELLADLLDQERYPLWAQIQLRHVETGLSPVYRGTYGFSLAAGGWQDEFAAAYQINLASTLNHAELTFPQDYQIVTTSGLTQTITLQHTVAYHSRNGQWLAGPLANTAWGASRTRQLPHLTFAFPERDSDLVQRLSRDWAEMIRQLCAAAPPFRCPTDYRLTVEMSSAPNAMYTALTDINFTVAPGQKIYAFSTPTYLGRPIDEDGYQALCRAYTHPLARQILLDIQQRSNLRETDSPAWVENRLHQLGLIPPPTMQQIFPGNSLPMPGDRLTPVCVPYIGQIAAVQ